MTTDPNTDVGQPSGIPEGMFLMPPPVADGEVTPPLPVTFAAGLTPKDAKGRRWVILRCTDGTVTADLRIPWQIAGQIGQQIAQGLAAQQAQAAAEENSGLVVPGRPAGGGGLFVPTPGAPVTGPRGGTPLNGAGR